MAADEDIARSQRLPVAGYVRKPVDLSRLVAATTPTTGLTVTVVRRTGVN